MRAFLLLLTAIFVFACSNTKQQDEKEVSYFYDFDSIDHYSITNDSSLYFIEKDSLSDQEKFKSEIIVGIMPETIADTLFIKELAMIGFERKRLTISQVRAINELFVEPTQDTLTVESFACGHVYRDIFVLKQKDSVVGVVKLCFECFDSYFIGSDKQTFTFQRFENYNKLQEILENKNE